MAEYRLVLHISDRDRWSQVISQAQAFVGSKPKGEIELVILADIFAGAVCLACDRRLREQMSQMVSEGHKILVCEQSLRNLNLRPEGLPEFVGTVPNALVEIVERQRQGFHYIKA